jgi:hypothetical protein
MSKLIPLLISVLLIAGCSKSKDDNPSNSLVGKWLLSEHFDASPSGGCNCWKAVSEFGVSRYEFKSDGIYKFTPPLYTSAAYCPNNYSIVNDSTLNLTYGCSAASSSQMTYKFSINGNILIIEYPGTGHKFKYTRVKKF